MKANKIIRKILFILLLIIVIPILLINFTIMIKSFTNKNEVPGVFGYKPMIVMTGSMEKTIMTGDLVIDKDYKNQNIKVGTIISFRDTVSTVITHRVVKVGKVKNETVYYTKGDNNNSNDSGYVTKDKIEGIYNTRIPKLGSFLNYIQTTTGMIIVILVVFIIGLLLVLLSGKEKIDKEDEELLKEFEEFKKNKNSKKDNNN